MKNLILICTNYHQSTSYDHVSGKGVLEDGTVIIPERISSNTSWLHEDLRRDLKQLNLKEEYVIVNNISKTYVEQLDAWAEANKEAIIQAVQSRLTYVERKFVKIVRL